MFKCPKCGSEMEAKSQATAVDSGSIIQCPKCKNVEVLERHSDAWFRYGYP